MSKHARLDNDGREVPDPVPMAPPVGYVRQPSLAEQIRNMVRSERLAAEVAAAGAETFEESEDFDVGDDYDPSSPYENDFDPPLKEVVGEVEAARKAAAEARPATPEPVASAPAVPAAPSREPSPTPVSGS